MFKTHSSSFLINSNKTVSYATSSTVVTTLRSNSTPMLYYNIFFLLWIFPVSIIQVSTFQIFSTTFSLPETPPESPKMLYMFPKIQQILP